MKTKIEWCDHVWNPVTGCTKVSAGCANCYAEGTGKRFWKERNFSDVQVHPERLDLPASVRKPSRFFVNSMSDLFHEKVSFDFIDDVFNSIEDSQRHTFLILTKRPERALRFFNDYRKRKTENAWIGVSAENQETADDRIPILLQIPASIHFLSCEPLLGKIDLSRYISKFSCGHCEGRDYFIENETEYCSNCSLPMYLSSEIGGNEIDWIIAGGESGPKARPMNPDWVRSIRDQCSGAHTPFFFKQWGEWVERTQVQDYQNKSILHSPKRSHCWDDGTIVYRVGKKVTGRLLDGREWNEFPEVKQ